MKVAYVLSQNGGPLPHYVAGLANAVAKTEDVYVLKPSETSADDVFSDELEVLDVFDPIDVSIPDLYRLNVNPLRTIRSVFSYRHMDVLKDLDPEVVHDPMGIFAHVKLFAYLHGICREFPFVVTYHELTEPRYPLSHPPMLVSHLIKDAIPNVPIDAGVVHTEKQRSILQASTYRPRHVAVLPHGSNEFFTEYDYDERPAEDNHVLFFGNVIREKGIDVLIESMLQVKTEIPDVTLTIAGQGSLSRRSRQIVDEHPETFEIRNQYVPNDEVGTLFTRAEIVALPYRSRGGSKGHSGVLSTAYSFGKPVIASTAGDFPRLVGDAGCGKVVPPNDAEALAAGIVELLRDGDQRREMAENSSAMADRLSWNNLAGDHIHLYEQAIANYERRRSNRRSSKR